MDTQNSVACIHIYKNVDAKVCPYCGRDTHEIDFAKQNKLNREWLRKNPDAWREVGWWSI